MLAGVIDIGSQSIKLVVGQEVNGKMHILESLRNVVSIGRPVFFKGRISQEAIHKTVSILEQYKKVLQDYDVTQVMVIATTAVREARNRDIFVDTVFRKTGFKVDVLNVGDVVYYIDAFLSHKLKDEYPIHEKNVLIAELGAGSFDVSFLKKGFTVMNMGLSIGSLRFAQLISQLDGDVNEVTEALIEYICNEFSYLSKTLPRTNLDDVFLIDENYDQLNKLLERKETGNRFIKLTSGDVTKLLKKIQNKSHQEIAEEFDVSTELAQGLIPYVIILDQLLSLIEDDHIYIMEASLSEAALANILLKLEQSKKYNKENQLLSVATAICQRYNIDVVHAKHVEKISSQMFDQLQGLLGVSKEDKLYLSLAAYLRDIGKFISNRAHHKHSQYIINELSLFRLTDEEIKVIACIARYHRKSTPVKSHPMYSSLPLDKRILIQKLSAVLRIANALDHSHKQKIKDIDVEFSKDLDVSVVVKTNENFLLEQADFIDKRDLFEEITGHKIKLVIRLP